MTTVQKQVDQLNHRSKLTSFRPGLLYLNLPPEAAQKIVAYSLVFILLVVAAGWLGYRQIQSSNTPRTVKIGLVAPFEGLYRASGYELLFAVKLALQERNQGAGLHGYRVELVALNDFNDPVEAAKQARVLAADPAMLGVVGHLAPAATLAAIPVYQEAELAVSIPWSVEATLFEPARPGVVSVAATVEQTNARLEQITQGLGLDPRIITSSDPAEIPAATQAVQLAAEAVTAGTFLSNLSNQDIRVFGQVEAGNLQLVQVAGAKADGFIFVSPGPGAEISADSDFVAAYQALSGLPPGPRAVLAYDAANVLLDSIEQAIIKDQGYWYARQPSRAEIKASILAVSRQGVSGVIAFGPDGRRIDAPVWVYQISEARYPGTVINP
ncbi:MAG: ABC transporter substrate-binding protein [Anaerolineaceae bacterium]|nr:ABC transporter substrate-binding protein [Anaerolineaceae bacterium]MCB9099055.1 ABC transporter substrate-binding protein [Anaerolineales bacterium]